jgi:hypothetical protein
MIKFKESDKNLNFKQACAHLQSFPKVNSVKIMTGNFDCLYTANAFKMTISSSKIILEQGRFRLEIYAYTIDRFVSFSKDSLSLLTKTLGQIVIGYV